MLKKEKTCKTCAHCEYDSLVPSLSFCNKSGSYLDFARWKRLDYCDKNFSGWEEKPGFFKKLLGG